MAWVIRLTRVSSFRSSWWLPDELEMISTPRAGQQHTYGTLVHADVNIPARLYGMWGLKDISTWSDITLTARDDVPVRSEQLLASLQPEAGVPGADDGIAKRDRSLPGDIPHDRLEVVVLDFSRALPGRDCRESNQPSRSSKEM